jgi:hypothetical protein
LEISDEIHYWGMELPLVFSLEGKKGKKAAGRYKIHYLVRASIEKYFLTITSFQQQTFHK